MTKEYNNMADLPESIANQPIDPNEDHTELTEKALTLVRKVFADMNKPNGVIWKRDDGQLIIALRVDGKWDWDSCKVLDMNMMTDKYDDLSAQDPFEFVYIIWNEKTFTTMNTKTIIPGYSFNKLFEEGKFQQIVEKDYELQYGSV